MALWPVESVTPLDSASMSLRDTRCGQGRGQGLSLQVAPGKRHQYVEEQTEFAPQQHPECLDRALHSGFRQWIYVLHRGKVAAKLEGKQGCFGGKNW